MWLLIVIHLAFTPSPPHVVHAEMVKTFATEKKCIKRIDEIMEQAKKEKKSIPAEINMGCVPLNGRNA